MGKVTWSGICTSASVSVISAWLSALDTNLQACGLVRTADTGQLDPTTLTTLPATGAYTAPMLYKFGDSQASSSPVIIRLRAYQGVFGSSTSFSVVASVGFATDGAGNLTGTNSGEFNFFNTTGGSNRTENSVATPSYAIHGEGYFGLCAHLGRISNINSGNSAPLIFMQVTRITGGGIVVSHGVPYAISSTPGDVSLRPYKTFMSTLAAPNWHQDLTLWQGGTDAATVGGATQIQRSYYLTPGFAVDPTMVTYPGTTVAQETQFAVAPDGISRTYLALGNGGGLIADANNARNAQIAMLWDNL